MKSITAAITLIALSACAANAETGSKASEVASIEKLISFVSDGKKRVSASLNGCVLEIETQFLLGCKHPTFFDTESDTVNLRTVEKVTQQTVRGQFVMRFSPYVKWQFFKGTTTIPVDYTYEGKLCSGDLLGHTNQSSFRTFVPLKGREMLASSLNSYIDKYCVD